MPLRPGIFLSGRSKGRFCPRKLYSLQMFVPEFSHGSSDDQFSGQSASGLNLKPPVQPAVWHLLLQGTHREMRLRLYRCTLGDNLIFCFHRRQPQPNMMGLLICAFHGVCQGGWGGRASGGREWSMSQPRKHLSALTAQSTSY